MIKKILIIVASLLLLVITAFLLWSLTPSGPGKQAEYTLLNASPVGIIQQRDRISFLPQVESKSGIIIYPGGRVDYRSYAPLARELALEGYAVFIVKMPLNMAFFDVKRAEKLLSDYPDIENWTLAGHSLGGIAASLYIKEEPTRFKAMIYLAAYPPEGTDLSAWPGKVLFLRGSEDALVVKDDIVESRSRLPADTQYNTIEGGNHAQFGDYGPQIGDSPALISPEEQMKQVKMILMDFLP